MGESRELKISELEKQMSEDLEKFINSRESKPYTEGWNEDNWEKEMQQHPLFMTSCPTEMTEMSPLLEALQQLKYDPAENTAEELAINYKDDGNENFRMKKYRWAIDSYTTGLKQNCKNSEVNAVLLTNRAASHFRIGNFGSALRDVTEAKRLKPNHLKALLKGAQCCRALGKLQDCLNWCDELLISNPENQTAIDLKKDALQQQKIEERNQRKWLAEDLKSKSKDGALKVALHERGVRFYTKHLEDDVDAPLEMLNSVHPAAAEYKVHINEDRELVWPVIFVYPEFGQTDFIQEFNENYSLEDHLNVMFNEDNKPSWDTENKYIPKNILIYFEDCETRDFVKVSKDMSLKTVISHERFQIAGGNPILILVSKDSGFIETFQKSHRIIN